MNIRFFSRRFSLWALCLLLVAAVPFAQQNSGIPGISISDAFQAATELFESVSAFSQTWVDETGTGYIGFRSSGDGPYRLMAGGLKFEPDGLSWSLAYGLGGSMRTDPFTLSVDWLTNIANDKGFESNGFELISRLRVAGGVTVGGAILFAGASLNSSQWMESLKQNFPHWTPDSPTDGRTWRHRWPGFFIGIRN